MASVHELLIAVRQEVGAISKGSFNEHHKFRFRGVEEVLNKVGPALLAHGVNCYPELRSLESRDITTKGGSKQREVTVIVAYHYVGPDGDEFVSVVPGEAADGSASAVSKAMSVALRITHLQALQIPVAMTDPEAGTIQRADDPLLKAKNEIWNVAKERGWVDANGGYQALSDDFAEWSQGSVTLDDAELEDLQKYLVHLRPHRKMSRTKGTGGQQ